MAWAVCAAQTPPPNKGTRVPGFAEPSTGLEASIPAVALGETQTVFLLRMVGEVARAEPGVPLEVFRERVARAVLSHPEALAARATKNAAGEATREIAAAALPQIDTRIDAAHRQTAPSTVLDIPFRRYDTGGVGLNLRQTVFDFGAIRASVGAGRERESAAAARAEYLVGDLALRAVQEWLEVYRSRSQLELAKLNVQAREAGVAYLTRRYELGAGLISDIWRAQARLAEGRASLAIAQTRVRNAEAAYREVFQEEPEEIDIPSPPPLDVQQMHADPSAAVREFPAVRSAEAAKRAAEGEVDATELRTRPNVSLELNALRRDVTGSGVPGNDYSATLALRYNFYSGGADTARIGQAGFRATEATEQARNISLQVERELAQALAEDGNSAALLAARSQEVTLAAASLRALRELFANRRGSLLDLLSAQEALQSAGVGLIDARVEQALARWRVLYFSSSFARTVGIAAAIASSPLSASRASTVPELQASTR